MLKNVPKRPYYDPDVTDPSQPAGVNGKAKALTGEIGLGIGYSYKRQLELLKIYDLGLGDTYPGLEKETKGTDKKNLNRYSSYLKLHIQIKIYSEYNKNPGTIKISFFNKEYNQRL
jgi:hypothetical protein